jgi:hypothetical protein
MGFWDKAQLALDVVSIGADLTGVGVAVSWVPDILNAGISLARGDFKGAALSAAGAIPVIGATFNAARLGRAADRVFDATKGADDAVSGFRAVSRAEADDIAKHGFRPHPGGQSMESKWFSESRGGAEWFQKNMSGLDDVVEARVPRSVYDRSYKHPNIDGTGPGICVECADLPLVTSVRR